MQYDKRHAEYSKSKSGQAEHSRQDPFELRRDIAQYRGATHPLCFTDEVLDHEFPEGFKPVNIEAYDGTIDPGVWIEDYILHIHMAQGHDLHAIKYLPLKLKGQLVTGLKASPKTPLEAGKSSKTPFEQIFKGHMSDHRIQMI